MTYTHLNTNEPVMIESYHRQNMHVSIIDERLNRSRQPIYNIIKFLKSGHTALDFHNQYEYVAAVEKILPKKIALIQNKMAQV